MKIIYQKHCYYENSFLEELIVDWGGKKVFFLHVFLLIFGSWQILSIKICQQFFLELTFPSLC